MHGLNKGMKADPKSGSGYDPDKMRSVDQDARMRKLYFEEQEVIFGGLQASFLNSKILFGILCCKKL
jgi:hypothetical protein